MIGTETYALDDIIQRQLSQTIGADAAVPFPFNDVIGLVLLFSLANGVMVVPSI